MRFPFTELLQMDSSHILPKLTFMFFHHVPTVVLSRSTTFMVDYMFRMPSTIGRVGMLYFPTAAMPMEDMSALQTSALPI
jgi:hypothetical protein